MLGYYFHVGDFTRDTVGLDALQIGVYRCLMDWCYVNETPLPRDPAAILKLIPKWRTTRSKSVALLEILQRFFVLDDFGWHQPHIERDLQRMYARKPIIEAKTENTRERQRRFRDNRKRLFDALREAGCVMPYNTPNQDLRAMCSKLGISNPCAYSDDAVLLLPQNEAEKRDITGLSRVDGQTVTRDMTTKPLIPFIPFIPTRGVTGREIIASRALESVEICRKAGMRGTSKADPRLLALLADGVEPEAFAVPAAQCVASGKGWAYLLGMVKGRLADAAETHQNAAGGDVGAFLRGLVRETPAEAQKGGNP